MLVEVYVSDDGEVIHQRFAGDPDWVDFPVLDSAAKFWQAGVAPSEQDRCLPHFVSGVKRFYRARLMVCACGDTVEDAAFEARAGKVLERLLAPVDAPQR